MSHECDISDDEVELFEKERERLPIDFKENFVDTQGKRGFMNIDCPEASGGEDTNWGTIRQNYYEGDSEDEYEEAVSIHSKMLKETKESDYIDADIKEILSAKIKDEKTLFEFLIADKKEKKEENKDIITKKSSLFRTLAIELRTYVLEMKDKIEPLFESCESCPANSKGLSFLRAKYNLLLGYCTNICFYMVLKLSGKKIKSHPVIGELIKARIYLEKMKIVEKGMKDTIDNLLGEINLPNAELRPNIQSLSREDDAIVVKHSHEHSKGSKEQEDITTDSEKEDEFYTDKSEEMTDDPSDTEVKVVGKKVKRDKISDGIDDLARFATNVVEDVDVYNNKEEGERRSAGTKILKNRGLMPYRRKDKRNSRVKHRKKYEEAVKKMDAGKTERYHKDGRAPTTYKGNIGIDAKLVRGRKI